MRSGNLLLLLQVTFAANLCWRIQVIPGMAGGVRLRSRPLVFDHLPHSLLDRLWHILWETLQQGNEDNSMQYASQFTESSWNAYLTPQFCNSMIFSRLDFQCDSGWIRFRLNSASRAWRKLATHVSPISCLSHFSSFSPAPHVFPVIPGYEMINMWAFGVPRGWGISGRSQFYF